MALNFPDSPTLNQVYTDSTSGFSYQWDGVVWQSYSPPASKNISIIDDISGSFNGSIQTFALAVSGTSLTPANAQQLRVVLGGIVQEPGVDYTVSGSDITFTTPPSALLDCSIVSLGPAVAVSVPGDGTVTPVKLSTGGPSWNTAGDLTVSGNVSIGGTLTYEDVTNVDSVGLITARSGINVTGGSVVVSSGNLSVSGVSTFQNNVFLGDNDSLYFGDSNDLRIYHSGSNSFIDEVGTGDLLLRATNVYLQQNGGENALKASQNGSVELYYDNSKKFETAGAGITVTGTTFTDQLIVSGVSTVTGLSGVAYAGITSTAVSKTLINREYCAVVAAGVTITLPASPSPGWEVGIAVGNFTDVVVARNGSNIMALNENFTMDIAYLALQFVYVDSVQGWRYF